MNQEQQAEALRIALFETWPDPRQEAIAIFASVGSISLHLDKANARRIQNLVRERIPGLLTRIQETWEGDGKDMRCPEGKVTLAIERKA